MCALYESVISPHSTQGFRTVVIEEAPLWEFLGFLYNKKPDNPIKRLPDFLFVGTKGFSYFELHTSRKPV
jgi:hypothetical protein